MRVASLKSINDENLKRLIEENHCVGRVEKASISLLDDKSFWRVDICPAEEKATIMRRVFMTERFTNAWEIKRVVPLVLGDDVTAFFKKVIAKAF